MCIFVYQIMLLQLLFIRNLIDDVRRKNNFVTCLHVRIRMPKQFFKIPQITLISPILSGFPTLAPWWSGSLLTNLLSSGLLHVIMLIIVSQSDYCLRIDVLAI